MQKIWSMLFSIQTLNQSFALDIYHKKTTYVATYMYTSFVLEAEMA